MLQSAGRLSLHDAFVVVDTETTGLDQDKDAIIEVGAVKFRGEEEIDTLSVLANPKRQLSPFIRRLTGITQEEVDAAPLFEASAARIRDFVGDAPLIGHNVSFDVGFLARAGVRFPGPVLDTREIAQILLPGANYSLAMLARTLGVGEWGAHRALGDAEATRQVFLRLMDRAVALDPGVVDELARLAERHSAPLRRLLLAVADAQTGLNVTRRGHVGGVDMLELDRRTRPPRRGAPPPAPSASSATGAPRDDALPDDPAAMAAALVGPGGALAGTATGFDYRPEQEQMLQAVAEAFRDGHHLLVEAGTGVGKSMAYLLPAISHALRNNARVVVSTNTISLQEQLVHKDLPTAAAALAAVGVPGAAELRIATLKGRANYLCIRRWDRLRRNGDMSAEEARLLGKLTCWLQDTATGDRAELRMNRADTTVWERLSAQGSRQCPQQDGACFLRAARERADAASVIVVNHSLLLADLAMGGGLLIPPYDHLIVDEAQRLEEEATDQFGARVTYAQVMELLDDLAGPRGTARQTVDAFRMTLDSAARRGAAAEAADRLIAAADRARQRLDEFFPQLLRYVQDHDGASNGPQSNPLRVTPAVRAQPDWANLEIAWENPSAALADVVREVGALHRSLDGLDDHDVADYDTLRSELGTREDNLSSMRDLADRFMHQNDAETISWVEGRQANALALNAAPLRVGETLAAKLFDRKRSIVLTSATLTVAGSYAPLRERLGLEEAQELLLGSPFDYPRSALVCIPKDVPEPNAVGYAATVARTLAELARAAGGHTLALFTSHAALRAAADAARIALSGDDVRVLAQGVDGAPAALVEDFLSNPKTLLLGTASFWEGVDLAGDALTVLVLTRLPFDVPSDPIFAARSEEYEDAFREYAVPQAVLRFRQGFGRLIRTASDRGVVAVLDRRLTARNYGPLFLRSLPPCTVEEPQLRELPDMVRRWLAAPPAQSSGC